MLSHEISAFGVAYIAGFDERTKVLIEIKVAWEEFCIAL